MYIYERENWSDFRWSDSAIAVLLEKVCMMQGVLIGRLETLGFESKLTAMSENLTHEMVQSSEIEGIKLNVDEVRSSIARRIGIENVKYTAPSHYVESVVAVLLDAVEHYDQLLTEEKLCGWQSAFFPTGQSNGITLEVGHYRTHEEHIVSGMFGREKVHYVAPSADRVANEMKMFIDWFNSGQQVPYVVRSAIAHLWFVSIHPFEDGNGRLARILSDMMLARGEKIGFRYYNISSQINLDKRHYYDTLERTQHGDGDITEWLVWYLEKIVAALEDADMKVSQTLRKSLFWQKIAGVAITERQRMVLNMFLDGYEGKINTKHWAGMAGCSKDTALRDIQDLVAKGVMELIDEEAKRPCYKILL